ncbi:unnamed protein product [Linum trigynum]|uniref:Uncharacterized protein n=1 Tax=Linum trigynum TaxID=586398 RepID=A0AAV2G0R7_9ROSI
MAGGERSSKILVMAMAMAMALMMLVAMFGELQNASADPALEKCLKDCIRCCEDKDEACFIECRVQCAHGPSPCNRVGVDPKIKLTNLNV